MKRVISNKTMTIQLLNYSNAVQHNKGTVKFSNLTVLYVIFWCQWYYLFIVLIGGALLYSDSNLFLPQAYLRLK